jgi:hypothetical protein
MRRQVVASFDEKPHATDGHLNIRVGIEARLNHCVPTGETERQREREREREMHTHTHESPVPLYAHAPHNNNNNNTKQQHTWAHDWESREITTTKKTQKKNKQRPYLITSAGIISAGFAATIVF